MNYIITNNAIELNIELFKLSVLNNTQLGCFEVITHPTSGDKAFVINDLDTEILVHPNCDTTRLKELVIAYTEEQKEQLGEYIDSIAIPQSPPEPASGYILGRFPFRGIVEGYTDIWSKQSMIDTGWIEE